MFKTSTQKIRLLFFIFLTFSINVFCNNNTLPIVCTYTLELMDTAGDGWDGGGFLTVSINGNNTDYALSSGSMETLTFDAETGDNIIFTYSLDFYNGEVSYNIINPNGDIIYSDGPGPNAGLVFQTTGCSNCVGAFDLEVNNITGTSADLSWTSSSTTDTYDVEFGVIGFTLGTGDNILDTGSPNSLMGLTEFTTFDVYVKTRCANIDEIAITGPISFTTEKLNDVGVTAINSPSTGCSLGNEETVSVTLTNFGNASQTSIPLSFSINGEVITSLNPTSMVTIQQGEQISFEFTPDVDLSQPGTYEFAVWTEMPNDVENGNDTVYLTVQSLEFISGFPVNENFENVNGNWFVGAEGQNQSFELGQPNGVAIPNAANGTTAWVTNLTGSYNNAELSYLESNCLDFSNLTTDPFISFSINYNTEIDYDDAWLDMSTDGGNQWSKVGTSGTELNWYNDGFGEVWNGNSGGWITAKNELTGSAGLSDIRLRFVFDSDGSVTYEGVGIDDISIFSPLANDMATQNIVNTTTLECGDPDDHLTITIFNNGTETQTGFDVVYQINNENPIPAETVSNISLAPNESMEYTFTTPFNSSVGGILNIKTWTELEGELNFSNDTTTTNLLISIPSLLLEDFESGTLSENWTTSGYISDDHANTSFVVTRNLYSGNPTLELNTPAVGAIQMGDSLTFDYRYVDWSSGTNATILGTGDQLEIQASTDCGMTYNTIFTIDESNHVTSNTLVTVNVDISSLVGQIVKFRFLGSWGTGDYYLDIDNINIYQCSPFNVVSDYIPETTTGDEDGAASVTADSHRGPYTYLWSTGDTSAEITGLSVGIYTVTLTDKFGCTEEVTFDIDVPTNDVNVIERVNLYPNPTSDFARLDMAFSQATDIEIQLTNAIGQVVFETFKSNIAHHQMELNLQNYPAGLFYLRIKAGDQVMVKKLIKN